MTEDEEAQIAMFMRVVEFLRKHNDTIKDNPEIVAAAADLKSKVQAIFDLLSEEDRDRALEKYKEDMDYMNEEKEAGNLPE